MPHGPKLPQHVPELPRQAGLCQAPVQVSPAAETQAEVWCVWGVGQEPGPGLPLTVHSQLTSQQSSRLHQQAVSCHPSAAQQSCWWLPGHSCVQEGGLEAAT